MSAVFEVLNIHSSRSLTCRSYQGVDFFCPFHLHPELEMVFIETGYVESFIGNQKQVLKSGELQLIGANVPHSFKLDCEAKESLLSKYIHIEQNCLATLKHIAEFEFVEQLLIQFSRGAVYQLDHTMTQHYFTVFEKQGVERLLAILSLFIELLKQQPVRLASDNYLLCDKSNQVMNFIMLNAADDLSLSQVAYQLNMSTSTLNRTLKKSLGMSYVEFVNHTRINLACDSLREGSETITQVALNSGFKSSSQFNKVFKQTLKISPREYRESYRDIVPQELKNQNELIWDVGEHC
ncbi:AraC family transcriptional regulator [Vibrio intestinalis]|uniref:AraC family transcriptional regulator n=1 Tax=Vibrio intestinalis TaxID=2933291 RepID=UPI0021A557A9|nr:AraC family transcriptional regulator [Vibrio intestinalis]